MIRPSLLCVNRSGGGRELNHHPVLKSSNEFFAFTEEFRLIYSAYIN